MKSKTILSLILLLLVSACSSSQTEEVMEAVTTPAPTAVISTATVSPRAIIDFVSDTGIQLIPTQMDLLAAAQIDIPLPSQPVWIAGIPYADGTAWAVAFQDGSLSAYSVNNSGYREVAIAPQKLSAGLPLSIYSSGDELFALAPPGANTAPYSQPVFIREKATDMAYIAQNGDLVIQHDDIETRLLVNALTDSRILVDEEGRLLLLSQPTDQYGHAVLGDSVEATGITLVATQPEPKVLQEIFVPRGDVIEGIYPLWTDMNNDGEREIIVTLSNALDGARIVAFREDGSLLAEGEPIGTGYRWRHQLIVAPFGEGEEMLLAVVRTPHIGGVIEYYQLNGDKLDIVESISGFSTHSIGSRNLFTSQTGDFDMDEKIELLIPDQSHTRLGIVGMDDALPTWLDLNAELITNLAAVTSPENEQISIAAGLSNYVLRIWTLR